MKVLIVPMLAVAQTEGPLTRSKLLATAFLEKGMQVALCLGTDQNCRHIYDVAYYSISVPVPMGLPKWIGLRIYPIADKFGIVGRKTVRSFEEVLHLTGASAYPYLKTSIEEIRCVIQNFQPDIVYSEFNISAIIAAKAENKPVLVSYSYSAQASYASSPQFAGGVNKILLELQQKQVNSALELFHRADCRIIPSSYTLEPVSGENCLFVGAMKKVPMHTSTNHKNCILVYMGNGTVSKSRIRKVIYETLRHSTYEVYIAGMSIQEEDGNIHLAPRFDFSELLPKTAVFINHGGQNSIMDGFIYGVPQLICPGKIFERKYNATIVQKNGAGILIDVSKFRVDTVSKAVNRLLSENYFRDNARKLGVSLSALGGAFAVADYIKNTY